MENAELTLNKVPVEPTESRAISILDKAGTGFLTGGFITYFIGYGILLGGLAAPPLIPVGVIIVTTGGVTASLGYILGIPKTVKTLIDEIRHGKKDAGRGARIASKVFDLVSELSSLVATLILAGGFIAALAFPPSAAAIMGAILVPQIVSISVAFASFFAQSITDFIEKRIMKSANSAKKTADLAQVNEPELGKDSKIIAQRGLGVSSRISQSSKDIKKLQSELTQLCYDGKVVAKQVTVVQQDLKNEFLERKANFERERARLEKTILAKQELIREKEKELQRLSKPTSITENQDPKGINEKKDDLKKLIGLKSHELDEDKLDLEMLKGDYESKIQEITELKDELKKMSKEVKIIDHQAERLNRDLDPMTYVYSTSKEDQNSNKQDTRLVERQKDQFKPNL